MIEVHFFRLYKTIINYQFEQAVADEYIGEPPWSWNSIKDRKHVGCSDNPDAVRDPALLGL